MKTNRFGRAELLSPDLISLLFTQGFTLTRDKALFDAQGGLGKMYQLFGDDMDAILTELNEAVAA